MHTGASLVMKLSGGERTVFLNIISANGVLIRGLTGVHIFSTCVLLELVEVLQVNFLRRIVYCSIDLVQI